MLQKFGIDNVQSRFRSEANNPPNEGEEKSIGAPKSRAEGRSTLRNKLTEAREFDEAVNDDQKKKANKEANDRIRKKQEDYLKSLANKKKQENEKELEEKKRKEKLRENLRNKVKGMLDNVERKPKPEPEEEEEEKEQRKMNPEDIQNFLERNKQKKKVFSNITDFDMWKKKHRISRKTKVFVCTGGYGTIRKSLTERGWFENKDPKSP